MVVGLELRMVFDLQDFIDNPTFEKVDVCHKDDLLSIAAHFDIQKFKSMGSKG